LKKDVGGALCGGSSILNCSICLEEHGCGCCGELTDGVDDCGSSTREYVLRPNKLNLCKAEINFGGRSAEGSDRVESTEGLAVDVPDFLEEDLRENLVFDNDDDGDCRSLHRGESTAGGSGVMGVTCSDSINTSGWLISFKNSQRSRFK